MATKKGSSPDEKKTYLLRMYQYQEVFQQPSSNYQPFNQGSDINPKREFTRSDQHINKTDNKHFEGKCFYCGKQGHQKQECRSRHREKAEGIIKQDAIQPAKQQSNDKRN